MLIKTLKKTLLVVCLTFSFVLSIAQPPPGDGDGEDPDEGVPIDGGIGFLAAAGIAYGTKKIIDIKNKKSKESEQE